jgi:hypothetical protein
MPFVVRQRVGPSLIYRVNIVYVKGCINELETVKITGISEARKTCTGDASCYIACVRLFGPATGCSLRSGPVLDRRPASSALRRSGRHGRRLWTPNARPFGHAPLDVRGPRLRGEHRSTDCSKRRRL